MRLLLSFTVKFLVIIFCCVLFICEENLAESVNEKLIDFSELGLKKIHMVSDQDC
jgi:hypothetical protein